MNCKNLLNKLVPALAAAILLNTADQSQATPYASGVANDAGTVSFILNEDADNVEIIFDGGGAGNTNDLGARLKGRHSFALGAHSSYQIHVTKSAPQVWTPISDDSSTLLQFYAPTSLDVNKNPASPYFGRVYVLEQAGSTGAGTTGTGRTVNEGIFALNADLSDALGQGDDGLKGGLDFAFDLFNATAGSDRFDPFKITVGQDDYVYIADAQDPRGSLSRVDPDLANGELVLAGVGNTVQPDVHSVLYGLHVRGSVGGGDLTVWGTDGQWQSSSACNSALRWDIGAGPLPAANVPAAIAQPGLPTTEVDSDLDVAPDGNIFILLVRAVADVGAVKVYSSSGTLLWTSLIGSDDVFLNSVNLKVSPDNTKLAIIRNDQRTWIVGLTNGPDGRIPDLSTTNLLDTFVSTSAGLNGRTVNWDAAGNLYVANRSSELLRVFSPGGTKTAITKSDGTFELIIPPTIVSVSATVSSANEQGPVNGQFTVTRSGDTSGSLTVAYAMSGTAENGVDYTALPADVTFLPGATATNINVAVTDDTLAEFTETAVLTIGGSLDYGIGIGSATVSILDNEAPEISFATTTTNQLLESYAPSSVSLQLARRGLLTPSVDVNLSYSGAANRGADFNGPQNVTIAASATTASITLTPLNDQAYEGNEIAAVNVASGVGYTIGTTSSGYVLLIDDEYPAGTVLFSDDFTTDSSASWQVNLADPADGFVEFAWDYGTLAGIPPAPGTTDASTSGLRLRCGNVVPQISALSVSPLTGNFTGDYRLKFDMWINYNGPMPDGGPGSTQHFDAGVGTVGDSVVWFNNPFADGIWFTCSGDGADGAIFGDYSAFLGMNTLNDDTGFYAAGVGPANGGLRDHAHPFYASRWGGQTAPAAQLALYSGQTGVVNRGNAGMAWHTVVITKASDTVTWQMDGVLICTVTNDPVNLSTNIFVGYQDRFAGSISSVPEMSFGLVDNLKVETFVATPAAPISISSILLSGGNVEITFTGPATASASSFKLQSSTVVTGGYADDNSATIIELGPGSFKATTAAGAGNRFYLIRR